MQDLISRQAAIDALYDWSEHSMTNAEAWHIKQVIGDIKSLPSAQPKTEHWIPVSERLPEYETEVLTCSSGGFIEIQSIEHYGEYWENQHGDWSDFDEVMAWQPLPESYKPESGGKE